MAAMLSLQQSINRAHQSFAASAQFADAVLGDLLEELLSARLERNKDAAAVIAAASAADVAVKFEAVDKLNGAVMLQSQAFGERLNGRLAAFGKTANSEKHEVLLRFEADGAGFGVAFAQEMADEVTKLGEGTVFGGGNLRSGHESSISYCDITRQRHEAFVLWWLTLNEAEFLHRLRFIANRLRISELKGQTPTAKRGDSGSDVTYKALRNAFWVLKCS